MTVRKSGGIHLEVLEVAPVVGVPIEYDLYYVADPTTMIATLEGAFAKICQLQLNDTGSGSFKIAADDPKAPLVHKGDLIKVKVDGIYRFAFLIDEHRFEPTETGGIDAWAGTKGALGYLQRATWYPPGWPLPTNVETAYTDAHGAEILLDGIIAAQARGTIPALVYDFTDLVDSQNAPWGDSASISIHMGTKLLDLWRSLVAYGSFESRMTPDLKLRAYVELGRHFETTVILRRGAHFREPGPTKDTHGSTEATRYLVEGQGGKVVEVSDPSVEADARVGRIEDYLSVGTSADATTLQRAGEAALEAAELDLRAYTLPVTHGTDAGQYEPFLDYDLGDWLTVDDPSQGISMEAVRVVEMTFSEGDGSDYIVEIAANSIPLEASLRLQRRIDALAGSAGGGGVSGSVFTIGGNSLLKDGRVAVVPGDQLGYLGMKISALTGLAKTTEGTAPDQTVGLALDATLDQLSDVDTSGAGDQEALIFDAATSTWAPGAAGGSVHPDLATHDAMGLATDSELASHAAASDPHTGYQRESEKGAANGYAGLGAGGLVPMAQLASGTPDGTKFIRDDGSLVTPSGGGMTNPMTTLDDIIVGGTVTGGVAAPARLGKGSDGQVLTVDPTTHHLYWATPASSGVADILDLPTAETDDSLVLAPDGVGGVEFRAEAGGGGGAAYLDTPALHGTYGDDFTAGPLDGKWSARSLPANLPRFTAGSWLVTSIASPGDVATAMVYEEAFTPTDEFDVLWAGSQIAPAGFDILVGPALYDNSGNGLCLGIKTNAGLSIYTYAAYTLGAALAALANVQTRNPYEYGAKYWLQIIKRGTRYWARYSLDGMTWSPYTPSTAAQSFTATKLAFGRLYTNTTGQVVYTQVSTDRINVENYLSRGNNLVRTPVGGTATYTASSQYDGSYVPANAADGNFGTAWAALGHADNPLYWQVAWSGGQSLNRVVLFSRGDAWGYGHLLFSDGSTVTIPQYLPGSGILPVDFPTKTGITSLRVIMDATPGGNPGFTEVEAYLAS